MLLLAFFAVTSFTCKLNTAIVTFHFCVQKYQALLDIFKNYVPCYNK